MAGGESLSDMIRREQVERLLRYMPTQYLGGMVVVSLFIAFFSGRESDQLVLLWGGFVLCIYFAGFAFMAFLCKTPRSDVMWMPFALGYGLGGGLVWGVASVLFLDGGDIESVLFLVPILIALSAVGVAGLVSYLPAVYMFLVTALSPMVLALIQASVMADIYLVLAGLTVVAGGGFGVAATLSNRQLLQAWRLRHELQGSESRFRDFAESASEWFWETDAEHRFSYLSARAPAVVGGQVENVYGHTREELAAEDMANYPDRWRGYLDAVSKLQPFRDFVYPTPRGPKETVWISISGIPIFDDNGGFLGYRGSGRDISKEREADEALKNAQRQLLAAVESFPGAFFIFDAEERMVMCNNQARVWYAPVADLLEPGIGMEDLVRANVVKCLSDEDRQADPEQWFRWRMAQFRNPTEPHIQHLQDGRHTLVQETKASDGSTISVRIDITDLVEAELAAAQANRSKSEFLANMSHELRTPLNAIIGFADAIRHEVSGPLDNETYVDYVGHIHQSGEHLLSLISDILDVSAVEAGRITLSERDLDLAEVLSQCLALVRGRADERDIGVELAVPDSLPRLHADERRVKQVVINLLGNAVKFTPNGGRVAVSAAVSDDGMTVTVSDTGPGLAPEEIKLALSPFGRTQDAIDGAQEGTGLGLPLSKSLMKAHGGTLKIESEPGRGCAVHAIFPAARVRAL